MTIDAHIAAYQKIRGKKYDPPLPDWVRKQTLNYPHHDKHSELIEGYRKAKKEYDEWVELLQSSFQRKWQDENPRTVESVSQCQEQLKKAQKSLELAEEALRKFNDHTPAERIALYDAEIKEWETQLAEARRLEEEYTEAMLSDPDAARQRLRRMIDGYSKTGAEYSNEQLSQLRSLRNDVESIEAKILNCQRDIQRIHELADERQRKARVQATMDAALPRFDEACVRFTEAWQELQTLAAEHGIRVVSPHNLQIPTGAIFRQTNSPYEGDSSIQIIFGKK